MTDKINSIKLDGDNNVVIQGLTAGGAITVNTVKWNDFVQKYTIEQRERIAELKDSLATKKELLDRVKLQLSGEINKLQSELDGKEKRIKEIIRQYEEKDISQTSALYQKAFRHFLDGDLEKALDELDEAKLDETEKQQAEARVLKADILQIQYKFEEAENNLLRATQIHPSWENHLGLANFYGFLNQFKNSEKTYFKCLELADTEYQRATTLNNLGLLQSDKNELASADNSYQEALEIYRKLAEINPQTYLHHVAGILHNLANLQSIKNEFSFAVKLFHEAMEIRKKLAEENPHTHLPDVAGILNDLAVFQSHQNDFYSADMLFTEALEIRRKLAEDYPQTFLPDVAQTLHNLANLKYINNELLTAEESWIEALQIRRKLAEHNPQTWLPDVAETLNNLGILQSDKNEFAKAGKSYLEALEIYRKLAEYNPQTYLPDVATTLNNFAILQICMNKLAQAEKSYEEALEIRKKLAENDPQTFLPNVATTLINISMYYQNNKPNREMSLKLLDEAFVSLMPFQELPYVQNYLKTAYDILENWGIDVEEYMKKWQ